MLLDDPQPRSRRLRTSQSDHPPVTEYAQWRQIVEDHFLPYDYTKQDMVFSPPPPPATSSYNYTVIKADDDDGFIYDRPHNKKMLSSTSAAWHDQFQINSHTHTHTWAVETCMNNNVIVCSKWLMNHTSCCDTSIASGWLFHSCDGKCVYIKAWYVYIMIVLYTIRFAEMTNNTTRERELCMTATRFDGKYSYKGSRMTPLRLHKIGQWYSLAVGWVALLTSSAVYQ